MPPAWPPWSRGLNSVGNRVAGSLLVVPGDQNQPRGAVSLEGRAAINAGKSSDLVLYAAGHRELLFDAAAGLVTVRTERGSKTIQIGKYSPKLLAELMLRELAEEGKD